MVLGVQRCVLQLEMGDKRIVLGILQASTLGFQCAAGLQA